MSFFMHCAYYGILPRNPIFTRIYQTRKFRKNNLLVCSPYKKVNNMTEILFHNLPALPKVHRGAVVKTAILTSKLQPSNLKGNKAISNLYDVNQSIEVV